VTKITTNVHKVIGKVHKMTMPELKQGNENISPTAWIIAHRRTFTDIPYSQAIFDEFEKIRRVEGNFEIPEELKSPQVAPQIEARYKLVSRLLNENYPQQVLEIAAGLSPRGLEITDNPDVEYIEIDLPGIVSQKRKIVDAIKPRANLYLKVGNALDLESLQTAVSHLDQVRPLVVVHEGLLRYLNFEEKAIVAQNVHALLSQSGGVWITPDITLASIVQAENSVTENQTDKTHLLIGMNIENNRFENVDEAQKFFENLGFTVERHSFMEVIDELVSPKRLGQTQQEVEALLKDPYVFVMRIKEDEKSTPVAN